ncbi:MAG TPA: CBS domain-containing protein [Tepidisphaeraceae bacterium]|nr:CBS domain-containing protein [Tepidisphaeraceae bacterium]
MLPKSEITLRQIMTRHIVTVSPDDSLHAIRDLFESHHFHHVLVVENGKLVGVISDRDVLRNLSPFVGNSFSERRQDVATLNRRAHQIMSRHLITASDETLLNDAVQMILDKDISCLPVVTENMHPLGIVTWHDFLRALAADR